MIPEGPDPLKLHVWLAGLELTITSEWYNNEDFVELGHVEFDVFFPKNGKLKGPIFPLISGDVNDPSINPSVAEQSLQTAYNLFQNNVKFSRWTSCRVRKRGDGTTYVGFFFTRKEDAVLFKLFSAIDIQDEGRGGLFAGFDK